MVSVKGIIWVSFNNCVLVKSIYGKVGMLRERLRDVRVMMYLTSKYFDRIRGLEDICKKVITKYQTIQTQIRIRHVNIELYTKRVIQILEVGIKTFRETAWSRQDIYMYTDEYGPLPEPILFRRVEGIFIKRD